MPTPMDLTGRTFGKLTVIEQSGRNNDNRPLWLCKCDCGATVLKTWKFFKKGKELWCGDNHPTKVCTACNLEKNKSTDFHKCGGAPHSVNPKCKDCIANWYIENKETVRESYLKRREDEANVNKMRERGRKYRNNNIDKEREYKKEYTRRDEVKERRKKIHHRRKSEDMNYNIKRRLRWRIRSVFKDLGMDGKKYKYKSSIFLLGCDMEFFKSYIESKFTDDMCWERISEIHIDHIIPCSQFDLTKLEDQKKCSHYTNLQPLWWIDNLIKGSKYELTSKDN